MAEPYVSDKRAADLTLRNSDARSGLTSQVPAAQTRPTGAGLFGVGSNGEADPGAPTALIEPGLSVKDTAGVLGPSDADREQMDVAGDEVCAPSEGRSSSSHGYHWC